MFVNNETDPISDDKGNTIHIRKKLDFGARMRVQKASLIVKSPKGAPPTEMVGEYDSAGYITQLLLESIVRWEGPAFEGVPCNPANINRLDPTDPLVDKTITEISNRNKVDKSDPKATSPDGENFSVDVANLPVANGTSTSP